MSLSQERENFPKPNSAEEIISKNKHLDSHPGNIVMTILKWKRENVKETVKISRTLMTIRKAYNWKMT